MSEAFRFGDDKMKSLLPGMEMEEITPNIAKGIISLPKEMGNHPESGEIVTRSLARWMSESENTTVFGQFQTFFETLSRDIDDENQTISTTKNRLNVTLEPILEDGSIPDEIKEQLNKWRDELDEST